MEVVEQLDYLVSNAEVMKLLTDIDAEAKSAGFQRPPIARETSKQVLRHLESVPSCNTTSEEVAKLIASLSEFAPLEGQEPLRESEMYNIANLRPTSVVALFAMIDKSLDRFGEERLDEMLTVITSILTAAPEEDEVGAAEEQGEDDEAMSHAGSH